MEKTFDELIEENIKYIQGYFSDYEMLNKYDVLNLLQQVREATLMEAYHITDEFGRAEALQHIRNLPTDRILITENEE